MGYLIELSVNLKKTTNLSQIKYDLITKAQECYVETYYIQFEFAGQRKNIYRNHCILTFKFPLLLNAFT